MAEPGFVTTPYKKKRRKRPPPKADHKHEWADCVYGMNFAGNFELSIGTYCPVCGKIGTPTAYSRWKYNDCREPHNIHWVWKDEALREFNQKTRTLPYFEIDLFVTKFVKLDGDSDATEPLRKDAEAQKVRQTATR